MAQYDFYQDEKCIIWERTRFTIDAPTQEDIFVASSQDKQIRIEDTEFLFDTAEALPIEYNDGNPTKEIFMSAPHQDKMIATNV